MMNKLVAPAAGVPFEAASNAGADDLIDLGVVLRFLRRRMRPILITAAVTLVAAAVVTILLPPQWMATSTVVLDTHRQALAGVESLLTDAPTGTTGVVETEAKVVQSRAIAERVVRRLHLDRDPEFNGALRPKTILDTLKSWKNAIFSNGTGAKDPDPLTPVVNVVENDLTVTRSGLTYAIDISFQSLSSQKAAMIANAFAEEYVNEQIRQKTRSIDDASAYLGQKVQAYGSQVGEAERKVTDYRVANNLITGEGGTFLATQDVSGLTAQLATAQAQAAQAQARAAAARRQAITGGPVADTNDAQSATVMNNLITQRATLSSKLADLNSRYKPTYPDVVETREALQEVERQIKTETDRTLSNLNTQAAAAQQQEAQIAGALAHAKAVLSANNAASVKLDELSREAATLRGNYDTAVGSQKQVALQSGLPTTDAHIVSPATTPQKPVFPNKLLFAALGFVLSGMTGLGAGAIAEMRDTSIRSADELNRRHVLDAVGILPLEPGATALAGPADRIVHRPMSRLAEAFRGLAAVLYAPAGPSPQVLAVTSSLPGEGKTTTSLALARTLAMAGRSVVLVDFDLRRRGLTNLLRLEGQAGVWEVLNGEARLEDALVEDPVTGVRILPVIGRPPGGEILDHEKMATLFKELRSRFDRVILDTAPTLAVADSRLVAAMADRALLLARWNSTPRPLVEEALQALYGVGAQVVGLALTQVDLRRTRQYAMSPPSWYLPQNHSYYVE